MVQNLMILKTMLILAFLFDVNAFSKTWQKPYMNIALYKLNDYYMYQLDIVERVEELRFM